MEDIVELSEDVIWVRVVDSRVEDEDVWAGEDRI